MAKSKKRHPSGKPLPEKVKRNEIKKDYNALNQNKISMKTFLNRMKKLGEIK